MSAVFNVHILASDRCFYEGECESLVVPSLDGQYGILAGHTNAMLALVPGKMIYRIPGQPDETVFVSGGLAKVENNDVLILADTVERPEEIDENRALRAMEEAQEAVLQKKSIEEYRLAQASLARAMGRLKIKSGANEVK